MFGRVDLDCRTVIFFVACATKSGDSFLNPGVHRLESQEGEMDFRVAKVFGKVLI